MRASIRNNKALRLTHKYLMLTFGCFLLAFGSAAFVSPLELVTGGVLSVGVIIQHFVGPTVYVVDIVTWVVQIIMLVVSFIFLGKQYTLRTIYAVLVYPALFSLLTRLQIAYAADLGRYVDVGTYISRYFIDPNGTDWALRILAGLTGGVFIGAGVGVCYFAGGSTGGFDVVSSIIARHTPMKESLSSLIIDASLVIIGIFLMKDLINGIVGVLSALTCALMVQYVYVNSARFVIADIISSEYEAIQRYVHETMERASTVIEVTGGYTGEDKKILRVAFSKRELANFRAYIASVDPRAFVTFTQASMINGEGFDPLCRQSASSHDQGNNGTN